MAASYPTRAPQATRPTANLTVPLEGRHDGADALDCDLGILGPAVPDPPVQAVDFRDDYSLCFDLLQSLGRQGAGCLPGMLQPHGDVEPVEIRRLGDAGIDQDRAQPGTAVGERRQLGISRLADIGKAASDQRLDRGVGLCHCGEHLTSALRRLNVAETDFEMPLTVLTAPDEG